MKTKKTWRIFLVPMLFGLLFGCATAKVPQQAGIDGTLPDMTASREVPPAVVDEKELFEPPEETPIIAEHRPHAAPDMSWRERIVTDDELEKLSQKENGVPVLAAWDILARLNTVARYYIPEAIRHGEPMKVPNDFTAYREWTPLPRDLPQIAETEKFILIVKDHPFLGWYENGRLQEDTQICVGKKFDWTRPGLYTVKDKDPTHVSRSYPNAFGQPAPMPWALRIYETTWIHAGDITEGFCSHGCINLPMKTAKKLFEWADQGTAVLVVNSVDDLDTVLAKHRANCVLYASACR